MKLVYPEYNIDILLEENKIYYLYVENPKIFREIYENLWNQCQGKEGKFILSRDLKQLIISKNIAIITNPIVISCNDRKIISKIYNEMELFVNDIYYEEYSIIQTSLLKLMEQLNMGLDYQIDYNEELSLSDIFKNYSVRIDEDGVDLLEKTINYIKLVHRVLGYNIVFFVNIRSFFEENELEYIYETCFYEKVYLCCLESKYENIFYEHEQGWIIDKDCCIIDLSDDNNTLPM